ncbi:MAG: starch-binding protein, partial [Ruminococcus sp.]|nr:starch-binding protein [Ruminococcus sp.]
LDWTFYGGDEIKVVYFDGTEIKTWYKDQADNYKIGADSDKVGECTVYFNPDGNSDWSYTYFTVQPKADPVDPSSEDESSEDASSEDESSEDASSEDESSEDASSEDESSEDESSEDASSEDESSEDASSEDESSEDESSEDESSEDVSSEDESSEEPEKVEAGYYLVGTLNGKNCWFVDATSADRMLTANPGAEGEYMLDWTFYGGDEIKVVYFDGTEIKTWYKDQADNYKIGADSDKVGEGTLYFNPDGNSDWSYTYFTVQPKADPVDPSSEDESSEDASSEDESSEDASSEDESSEDVSSEEPSSEEPTEPVGYTAYCVNSGNYATVSAHAWNDGGSGTTWPGVAMTKTDMTSPSGAAVWTYTFDTSYGKIIFNNNGQGSQTADLEFKVGQYYDLATKAWYENLEDIPVPTTYGTGYYLPGSFNSWSQTADEFMTETKGGTTGTVTLTLEANKTYEFKVKSGSSWYGYSTAITGTVTGKTLSTSAGNAKITTKAAGEYVFTFNTSNKQLSVTYPS